MGLNDTFVFERNEHFFIKKKARLTPTRSFLEIVLLLSRYVWIKGNILSGVVISFGGTGLST